MKREKLYLSTIDANAAETAQQYGLGIEIAEFCTAYNMDDYFPENDALVRARLRRAPRCVFHGPFNELFPCAIDPKARALAAQRYRQAAELAVQYGAEKMIVHGGFVPMVYFPQWYVEQSIAFWKEWIADSPLPIVLENVLEQEPGMLAEIAEGVNDPRLKLCLDIGHTNVYSDLPVMDWLERWAPQLSHFHIHNNDGTWDTHSGLGQGNIPIRELLNRAGELCPDATYTIETVNSAPDAAWLIGEGILEDSK